MASGSAAHRNARRAPQSRRSAITALLTGLLALAPGASLAGSDVAPQFRASVYAWLPDVAGQTTFPAAGGGSDVNIDAAALMDKLELTFMGSLSAQWDRWGVFADALFLALGDSRTTTRGLSIGDTPLPADVSAATALDLDGWIWTLAGSYRRATPANATHEVFAGVRFIDAKQALDWQLTGNVGPLPPAVRAGAAAVSLTGVDAITGLRGAWRSGDGRWFAPYYLDLGSGDSRLTWQAIGGVGRAFAWGEVTLAWRHLEYDLDANEQISRIKFSGPALAASFRW